MTRRRTARSRSVVAGAALLVLVAGCTGRSSNSGSAPDRAKAGGSSVSEVGPAGVATGASALGTAAPGTGAGAAGPAVIALPRPVTSDRDLVRTGFLTVRVGDVGKAARLAADIATGAGGSVYDERTDQQREPGEPAGSTLTIKVAPEHFADAMTSLSGLGQQLNRTVSVRDVTDQVADVGSRLDAQRAGVARVRDLLAQAKSLQDIVTIEAELTRRQADLESLQARSKALAAQTELATITAHLQAVPTVAPRPVRLTGFLAGLATGWRALSRGAGVGATAVGTLLPFLALAAVAGLVAWRLRARWRGRRTPVASPAEP